MKSTKKDELYCSVFGHNYFKLNSKKSSNYFFICSSCQSKAALDTNGNLVELQKANKDFKAVLRQLFILKRKKEEGLQLIHKS